MAKNPAAVALGRIKSKRKSAASAENGKLGGRPKGAKDSFKRIRGRSAAETTAKEPNAAPAPIVRDSQPLPERARAERPAWQCVHGRERKFCVYCKRIGLT